MKVPSRIIPAHKIVLAARSNNWSDANLLEISSLGMDVELFLTYRSQNLSINDSRFALIILRFQIGLT